jgi:hypothetical protein
MIMAGVAAHAILEAQAGAPRCELSDEIEAVTASRAVVHQAAGMVFVQLGVPIGEALSRLRARAYAEGRSTEAVARKVVDRQIRFDDARP